MSLGVRGVRASLEFHAVADGLRSSVRACVSAPDGECDGDGDNPFFRKERSLTGGNTHARSAMAQFAQAGRRSSQRIWRRLHSTQPFLDFLCDLRCALGCCCGLVPPG